MAGDHHQREGKTAPRRLRNISELAALAGVSPGTVSRALANKTMVNVETRERIQQLARDHGFRLNQMASKLRTRQTKVIGVAIPLGHEHRQQVSDPFFMTMLGHLADGLSEAGYDLMLSRVVPQDEEWLDRIVDSGMVDGVLLIGQSDQFRVIERVAGYYKPMVVWGVHRADQVHCSVGSDNRAGGRMAAEHLIARGCRTLMFLGDNQPPEMQERYQGAAEAAAAAGLAAPVTLPVPLAALDIAERIRALMPGIAGATDGIVAASDLIAANALLALGEAGVAVPDRIAVTGYDDLPVAEHSSPKLTTIRQNLVAGAHAMIEALFARMRGEAAASVIMPPELVIRASA